MVQKRKVTAFIFGYGLVLGLVLVTVVLILAHGGNLLNYLFPVMATVAGIVLINYRSSVYVAYVWWIWLFTPEVRRFVDFQTHYHNISPVMVTPVLVTALSLAAILRRPKFLLRRSTMPFTMLALIFLFALVVGAFGGGVLPAAFDSANWILPLGLGLFIMMRPEDFSEKRDAIVFAMISGAFLAGAYGLYQFFRFPPWDAYWLTNSNLTSEGLGVAEQVRLFGPLNSSEPFAVVLMSGLVFALVAKGSLRIAAGAVGFPALGLASVRESWGAWVLAALFIVWRVGGRTRLWILAIAAVLVLVIAPLVTIGPIATILTSRLSSIVHIQNDNSFQTRKTLYVSSAERAFSEPIGLGFGQFGASAKLSTGQSSEYDVGVLLIPLTFGWFGLALFVWAVGAIGWRIVQASRGSKDRIIIAAAGLFFGLLAQSIFSETFTGVAGISLWMGAALALGPISVRRPVTARSPAGFIAQPAQF